jgi:hypothetical protein
VVLATVDEEALFVIVPDAAVRGVVGGEKEAIRPENVDASTQSATSNLAQFLPALHQDGDRGHTQPRPSLNYLKGSAPKTAAAVRAAVNPNPTLSKIIQFNVVPIAAGVLRAKACG